MEHARPPPELNIEGSPAARADAWTKWWKQFEIFLKASGTIKETPDVQASLLVNLIGADGYEIYSTFVYEKGESADDLKCLKNKFDTYFGSKKANLTMLRFKFFTRNQSDGESIGKYVTALRVLSQDCKFEHLTDDLIKDRIVCGISNSVVRDRLLRTDDLNLAKAVQICEADEISRHQSSQIEQASSSIQVDGVAGRRRREVDRSRDRGAKSTWPRGARGQWRGAGGPRGEERGAMRRQGRACQRCGAQCGDEQQCSAIQAICYSCGLRGHFSRMCRSMEKRVHKISESNNTSDESDDELIYVNVISDGIQKEWTAFLDFSGKRLAFKLDTGSMINILSKSDYEQLGYNCKNLSPYSGRVHSYTGNVVPIIGKCYLLVRYKQTEYKLKYLYL